MLEDMLDYYKNMAMKFLQEDENCTCTKDTRKSHRELIHNEIAAWMNCPTLCSYGFYPLHYACFQGDVEVIKLVIKNGGEINLPNKYGVLPVHAAA